MLNEKPVKDPAAPGVAELAAAVEALVAVEEELTPIPGKENDVCVVVVLLLVPAGVEALGVVTVENNGAVDVPKDREVAFDTVAEEPTAAKPSEA